MVGRPNFSRRVEGFRSLRSDGKPNFSNRVYRVEKDLEVFATRPPVVITPTSPFIEAMEKMYEKNVRSLIVVEGRGRYRGVLLVENALSYLGGGELYNIVLEKLGSNFHKAMKEPIESIMEKDYPFVFTDCKLPDLISLMVSENLSLVPVLRRDMTVYSVMSEHDIVELIAEKRTGVKAREIMTPNIVTVESSSPLVEALTRMVRAGLRRVFVENEVGQIIGVLTAAMIVRFYGSHVAFKYVKKGYLEDTTSVPIREIGWQRVHAVKPDEDVGDVVVKMLDTNVGAVLVEENDKIIGMITERDVFYALAVPLEEG